MTSQLSNDFWDKWYHANELKRLELAQTLTGFKKDYSQASLLNSYLTDLAIYLEEHCREEQDPYYNE